MQFKFLPSKWYYSSTAALISIAAIGFWAARNIDEVLLLDLEIKAHLADSLERSTYDLDGLHLHHRAAYNHLVFMRRDRPFDLRLRDEDRVIEFGLRPEILNIFVSRSIVQEITVQFHAGVDPAAIGRIYKVLSSQGWTPMAANCSGPEPVEVPCAHVPVFDPSMGQDAESYAQVYLDNLQAAHAAQDIEQLNALGYPILGTWMTDNGSVVRVVISDRLTQSGRQLVLHLRLFSQYAAIRANALSSCFHDRINERGYTPEQARIIYGALYETLGPPALGDELITDPIRQELFAWGQERLADVPNIANNYFTSRAWDRHYDAPRTPGGAKQGNLVICDVLPELERAAGYIP